MASADDAHGGTFRQASAPPPRLALAHPVPTDSSADRPDDGSADAAGSYRADPRTGFGANARGGDVATPPAEASAAQRQSPERLFTYSELEQLAAVGGYTPGSRDIYRITPVDVHHLYAGLLQGAHEQAPLATTALAGLRHWLVHGDNRPPSVRGAAYARSDGELWLVFTMHPSPALVRGKSSHLDDLRKFLAVTSRPEYDGSLGVATNPPIQLKLDNGLALQSPHGVVRLDAQQALRLERSLSATLRRRDRRCVLCLPGEWQSS